MNYRINELPHSRRKVNTERNAVTVLTVYNCFDGTTWSG